MIKNIKSSYIIKKVLSHLIESNKLKLIKNNKSIQKALNINITDYKIYHGRNVGKIIIYETKLKVKEYDLSKLIFDGDYLNNKRNGKGKEFNNGYILFEGEYLNGKRNGKGKEYNKGILIFEGEYLNGLRYGKGKEYYYYNIDEFDQDYRIINEYIKEYYYSYENYKNEKIIFEGKYLNGKRNGKGKEYNNGKIIFEGIYLNGKRWNGKLKEYNYEGILIFEREYLKGKIKENVREYYKNGKLKFEGVYLDGEIWTGHKYYNIGKLSFEDKYLNGRKVKTKIIYYNYINDK